MPIYRTKSNHKKKILTRFVLPEVFASVAYSTFAWGAVCISIVYKSDNLILQGLWHIVVFSLPSRRSFTSSHPYLQHPLMMAALRRQPVLSSFFDERTGLFSPEIPKVNIL